MASSVRLLLSQFLYISLWSPTQVSPSLSPLLCTPNYEQLSSSTAFLVVFTSSIMSNPSTFPTDATFDASISMVNANVPAIPPPPHTPVPLLNSEEAPNATLIAQLFDDPQISKADAGALRTQVYTVLNAKWYMNKNLSQMPRGTLDTFAQRRGQNTVCLFCNTPYTHGDGGLGCVKGHFSL
ncbi:hypothetical protein M408DRAFT_121650 [Serendipita vermifera MAFF 305830]|uniref:Uncharacterized protein n=1 Tax=Serendipita vermifera MAFF 305830 TaxID=933852 RepID=A0A0C2WT05_SERVB|nr:hypothetical protein M408DRAFT_121650 [Serendipita vermifera MAFF 305830]